MQHAGGGWRRGVYYMEDQGLGMGCWAQGCQQRGQAL